MVSICLHSSLQIYNLLVGILNSRINIIKIHCPNFRLSSSRESLDMLIFRIFRPQPLLQLFLKRLVLLAAAKETSKAIEEACTGKCGVTQDYCMNIYNEFFHRKGSFCGNSFWKLHQYLSGTELCRELGLSGGCQRGSCCRTIRSWS